MTASNIAVDGGEGKLLQTYENTVGGESVHSEAVTLVHTDGTPVYGARAAAHIQATTSGETPALTPTAGKKIRLHYYALALDPSAAADVTVGLRWDSGTDFHSQILSQYGGVHASDLGNNYIEGGTDEVLTVNLSASKTVDVNIRYEEVD